MQNYQNNKEPHILICDDQQFVHETIGAYLKNEGFGFDSAYDGLEAIRLCEEKNPDLILLDVMMPGMSGIEVCREIRKKSNVPIIMLTARGEEIDKILGLEFGADDYIVKPFSNREVLARIKAVMRRVAPDVQEGQEKALVFANLSINITNYEVKLNGVSLGFTPKEVEILHLLASNAGRVFEREQILSKVWGYDYFGDTRAVDTQIKRIRSKMPEDSCAWGIRTVYGVGYKFGPMEASSSEPVTEE